MDNLNPKDLTPAEAIKKMEEQAGKLSYSDAEFNPEKNPKVICIMQMLDGNWKAFGQRNGKMMVIRAGKPQDALGEYLTSEG